MTDNTTDPALRAGTEAIQWFKANYPARWADARAALEAAAEAAPLDATAVRIAAGVAFNIDDGDVTLFIEEYHAQVARLAATSREGA